MALGDGLPALLGRCLLLPGLGRRGQTTHPAQGVPRDCSWASSSGAWFCRDPAFPEQLPAGKALEVLEQVWGSLRERPRDWQDCVRWARRHWQSRYHNAIAQLLHTFPPEHVSPAPTGLAPPHALSPLPATPFPSAGCPTAVMGTVSPGLNSAFPLCQETSPGVPFWAGDRSCPHPLTFNPDNVSAGESCGAPHWGQCGWGESRVCARGTVDAGP